MQILGVTSLFLCVATMFLIFVGQLTIAVWIFGIALIMMILSLGISIYEIQISVKALNLHLSDMEQEDITIQAQNTGFCKKGYVKKVYRSNNSKCKNCPLRSSCIGKSDFKMLDDSIDKPYYDRMHERMQTPYAKKIRKIRSSTVEPVLGTLINFMNMKRVNTRGIENATKHVLMAALCYNLKKYMKFMSQKSISAVKSIDMNKKRGLFNISEAISGLVNGFLRIRTLLALLCRCISTHTATAFR